MIYLATPYSSKDKHELALRYMEACRITAHLLNIGMMVFSPIVHCHQLKLNYELPAGWEFWGSYDKHMIALAEMLLVATMHGWRESVGVQAEINFAWANKIVIGYINPKSFEITTVSA